MNSQTIETQDGYPLSASFFRPEEPIRGSVLIVSAMGVPKGFYAALASWLASNHFLALTFDFRGTGDSLYGSLRDVKADLMTWSKDTGIMLNSLAEQTPPGLPINWIGHSLGGQILPFVPGRERLAKVVMIASGSGYWRENSSPIRWLVPLLWYVIAPFLMSVFGYFPGRQFKLIGDLPLGVMRQWRRWCLDPEYVVGAEGDEARQQFASVQTPITSVSFTDDAIMSAQSTESLHRFYASAPLEIIRISPQDYGLKGIGHFGFFRRSMKDVLWKELLLSKLAH